MLGATPYSSTASFTLAVVPLFILMGALCFRSGISNDLFNAAYAWCGRLPGGLGVSSVIGCAGFAAVCGDSMATARNHGYRGSAGNAEKELRSRSGLRNPGGGGDRAFSFRRA